MVAVMADFDPPRGSDGRRLVPRRQNGFVTIRDVAADAGVSIATVSRALNNNGYVAGEVKKRVLASSSRLGFRPSERARSMRNLRTMTIGAILPELVNPVNLEFLRGIEEAANARGYVVLVATSQGSPDKEREILHRLVAERTDGVVLGTFVGGRRNFDVLAEHHIPVVPPPGPLSSALNAAWTLEESAATRQMAERLVDLGHRKVTLVSGHQTAGTRSPSYYRRSRYEVLRDVLGRAGVEFDVVMITRGVSETLAADEVASAVTAGSASTAWVAANHLVLSTLLIGLGTAGLNIPEDVSVVGYGDSPWATAYRPTLSVISHDTYGEALELTAMLLAAIDGEPPPSTGINYKARFVERQSTGPAPIRRKSRRSSAHRP